MPIPDFIVRPQRRRTLEGLGTAISPGIAQVLAGRSFVKDFLSQPMASPLQMLQLYNQADLPIIPTERLNRLRNAGFVPPESVKQLNERLRKPDVAKYRSLWDRLQNRMMENRARRLGMIIYDPYFKRTPVMAHEVGHAAIHHGKSGKVPEFLQRHLYGPSIGQTIGLGLVAGINHKGRGRRYGAISGALSFPFLTSEFLASRNALKYLRGMGISDEDLDRYRATLAKAYGTYAAQAAFPLAIGTGADIMHGHARPPSALLQKLRGAFKRVRVK